MYTQFGTQIWNYLYKTKQSNIRIHLKFISFYIISNEISFFVHYITKDGFIYLRRNGGSDHQIAPSKRVNIHTEKGKVKAVFGWPAIHTRRPGKEKQPTLENIFLDCGAKNADEVRKMGIDVGCVVTYEDKFMIMNKNN